MLEDGHDEIITTSLPRTAESEFKTALHRLKVKFKGDLIFIYSCPEFSKIKGELIANVGKIQANIIMNDNLAK